MDTKQMLDNALRCADAYQRGLERGQADEIGNYYNAAPLSGEWAGESVVDLLGDLWSDMDPADDDTSDLIGELCDHYEQGYMAAFTDRVFCDVCGDLCDPTYAVSDNGVAYCGLACSGDLGS